MLYAVALMRHGDDMRQTRRTQRVAIGRAIRQRREQLDMDQAELAQLVCVGRSTLSAYETGKRHVPSDMLADFAAALDCTVEQLANPPTDLAPDWPAWFGWDAQQSAQRAARRLLHPADEDQGSSGPPPRLRPRPVDGT